MPNLTFVSNDAPPTRRLFKELARGDIFKFQPDTTYCMKIEGYGKEITYVNLEDGWYADTIDAASRMDDAVIEPTNIGKIPITW